MRKLLFAAVALAGLAAAAPQGAQAMPMPQAPAVAAPVVLAQYYNPYGDWRWRQAEAWRRHEAWREWRRERWAERRYGGYSAY